MSTEKEKNTPAPSIQLLTTGLGKRFNREWIFNDLSKTFTVNNTYAVTGPNGSGKSTLLSVLWGQTPPSKGTLAYEIDGETILAEDIYKEVSIAAPYLDLIDEFSLQELINFHFKMRTLREGIILSEVADRLELRHAVDKTISNFSSGMRQRVKLGLAIYTKSHYLFLDEPFTNLDKQAIKWYQSQLESVKNTITFIASNDPLEFEKATEIINIADFK